ncbi:macro domain-containing protein [Azospirillum sp. SYSU D00513]|uniref:macro domain-containing protein n=1 Tax=Azospirillum sp. SYSU D00513 TaxID=2812561 RepID=UPI001A961B70|nr:macro domain-containing protein [Azospirillum sp. SYSU D00513]
MIAFDIEEAVLPGRVVVLNQGITDIRCDALVNSAHPTLMAGGGVSGAIHRAAGPELERAAAPLGPLEPGEAVATPAFLLPARHVIHAVAPVWHGGGSGEMEGLERCYAAILARAEEVGARSLVIPTIGTGIYGWPAENAAEIGIGAAERFVASGPERRAVFATTDGATARVFTARLYRDLPR